MMKASLELMIFWNDIYLLIYKKIIKLILSIEKDIERNTNQTKNLVYLTHYNNDNLMMKKFFIVLFINLLMIWIMVQNFFFSIYTYSFINTFFLFN